MKLLSKQKASSILGLALDGNRLEAVVVRRSVTGLQVKESLVTPLALSPLGGDPALVGREIRNHLDQAGVRERRCVVCIPAAWVLTMQTKLPELSDADADSFLQLEAERGFPSGYENLHIVSSRSKAAAGEQFATLIAVPRNHLDTLEKALKAAQLKPASFVLGIAALESGEKEASALALALGSNGMELGAVSGGGLVAIRSLDGVIETAGAQRHADSELVAREIRITLGQMPQPLAEGMRSVKIFARGELARQFTQDISPRLQAMGLRAEMMDRASGADFSTALPSEVALSPALAAAANHVKGLESGPELLPPKVHPLQEWMAKRVASKKLGWAGLAAAGAAACVGGIFIYQQIQLTYWQNEKAAKDIEAKDARAAQDQIKKYAAWYDESFRALNILKTLAEAFPQDSSVTAKSVQIRNLSEVTCAGVARDSRSYVRVVDALSQSPGVKEVATVDQRGNQFTFKFQWEGNSDGN
jgi:hypothetical protein